MELVRFQYSRKVTAHRDMNILKNTVPPLSNSKPAYRKFMDKYFEFKMWKLVHRERENAINGLKTRWPCRKYSRCIPYKYSRCWRGSSSCRCCIMDTLQRRLDWSTALLCGKDISTDHRGQGSGSVLGHQHYAVIKSVIILTQAHRWPSARYQTEI